MERGVPVWGHEGDVRRHARARHELREREKRELREERDRIVLELARTIGTEGLAQCLGTTSDTSEALVRRARERVPIAPSGISARRIVRDADRWREADRHYEALGRSARLPPFPPQGS